MRSGLFKQYFTIFLITLLSCTGLLGLTLLAFSGANYTAQRQELLEGAANRVSAAVTGEYGALVDTPPKELELLYHLARNANRVFTRDQLLDEVWGFEYFGDSRTVDVHIKRLREKLEGVSDQWCLKTVWGVGYKFEVK